MPRSTKIGQFLAADGAYQPLLAKMREIRLLDGQCQAFLPPELAHLVRASNLRDGRLVLLAAHASAAAKLRLQLPSLLEFLQRQGAKVNAVSVRVQPRQVNEYSTEAPRPRSLPLAAFSALSELYGSLRESPLKSGLKQFLKRDKRERRRSGVTAQRAGKSSAAH